MRTKSLRRLVIVMMAALALLSSCVKKGGSSTCDGPCDIQGKKMSSLVMRE